ncbi:MAG: hypothetical protein P8Z00_20645, partial [Anaerolineales bacterium]
MKWMLHFLVLASMLFPASSSKLLSNPPAATAGQHAQTDSQKPLLPPGFVTPTSIQAPAWSKQALHNPTWGSASTSANAASALYTLGATASQDSAPSAAALPRTPQDLGDWNNTEAKACI